MSRSANGLHEVTAGRVECASFLLLTSPSLGQSRWTQKAVMACSDIPNGLVEICWLAFPKRAGVLAAPAKSVATVRHQIRYAGRALVVTLVVGRSTKKTTTFLAKIRCRRVATHAN